VIRALFCDFYGTLVFEDDMPVRAAAERIYRTGCAGSREEIGAFWGKHFFELCAASFGKTFRTQRDLERQSLRDTVDRFRSAEDAAELSEFLFEHWVTPPIFEDSKQFLAESPVPVYIASNIDTADLYSALGFHGLNPTGVVTSEEARSYKPRNEIFALTLRKFGLEQGEVVHIGDSVTSDILGAKQAGIDSVWINRKSRSKPPEVEREAAALLNVLWLLASSF